ncbi:YdjY domain-containing protein [Paludisphaera rhizosphaerae]|uniref:YdjY domain-containing protein n=1 Tax=Paludisphaera rhizosphaerae TaxID=2711216 RepID=UPI0013EA0292|nr:YdjY domain-containing protein [Paludisphaera rhizosphaerae]
MNSLILTTTLLSALGWQAPAEEPAEPPPVFKPEAGWKPLGRSLWLDPVSQPRRLILRARVVLREGPLEHLLCLRGTKEHEAVLATDAPPTLIHAGLLAAGLEPGGPVRFRPEFKPPHGPPIAVTLRWKNGDEIKQADARSWIRDEKTRKQLDVDWVFAGSTLYDDPVTKKTIYAAEEGDLITVANFASAILDLPIASSAEDANRTFVAFTEHIPPLGSEVQIIFSARPPKPKPTP